MANYNWSTKTQAYLAKIAGKEVENLPEPTTKEQALLKEIAENGSGGGTSGGGSSLVVRCNDGTGLLDKTWNEIKTAAKSGVPVVITHNYEDEPTTNNFSFVSAFSTNDYEDEGDILTQYWIYCHFDKFVCYAPDDYPEWSI